MAVFKTEVSVGAGYIGIESDDYEEFLTLKYLHEEMDRHLNSEDAVPRVRKRPDAKGKMFTYFEYYSPSLKASKKISKTDDPLTEKFPYLIMFSTPWIRFIRLPDGTSKQFLLFNNLTKELREAGFTEADKWYEGEMEDGKFAKRTSDAKPLTPDQLDSLLKKKWAEANED